MDVCCGFGTEPKCTASLEAGLCQINCPFPLSQAGMKSLSPNLDSLCPIKALNTQTQVSDLAISGYKTSQTTTRPGEKRIRMKESPRGQLAWTWLPPWVIRSWPGLQPVAVLSPPLKPKGRECVVGHLIDGPIESVLLHFRLE